VLLSAIFASILILFPAALVGGLSGDGSVFWLKDYSAALSLGQSLYVRFY